MLPKLVVRLRSPVFGFGRLSSELLEPERDSHLCAEYAQRPPSPSLDSSKQFAILAVRLSSVERTNEALRGLSSLPMKASTPLPGSDEPDTMS